MTDIQCKRQGDLLSIMGEMTIYQSKELKEAMLGILMTGDIRELDLGEVSEFDSAGFQLIALVRREISEQGRTLTLRHCSQAVKKVLDAYAVSDWVSTKAVKKTGRRATKKEN